MRTLLGNTRSIAAVCVALAFGGFAALAIRVGRISASFAGLGAQITKADNPAAFWSITAIAGLVAIGCVLVAVGSPAKNPVANIGETELPRRLAVPLVIWLVAVGVFILILGFTGKIAP
jgi:hypothetical protein